ncbi:MAG TPA: hypothetical protein VK770_02225 [Candidatus Acidoferrum sp.]|nr:hypothetical protein [Candidatus Acidoferrum sp.]
MRIASLILLALLSGKSAQVSSSAMVRAGGHTYQLFCSQEGELILASETGLCEKTESGGVQRFEIRNEDGEVQFFQDAPSGNPFSYVGIFSIANAGREILDVDTSHDEIHGNGQKPVHLIYYFDPTAAGLVPFQPPLVGVDGFAHLSTGVALSRSFDAGFFQFSVLLDFNVAAHRIEIMPDQIAFSAFATPGREKSGPSPASGGIQMYSNHDNGSAKSAVRIAPGHMVTWWQSVIPIEKPASGQIVTVLAAWAPASLKPADNAPEGVQMVYFDWNNLWLQIQVDDHTGWIKGTSSFRTIGLEMTSALR